VRRGGLGLDGIVEGDGAKAVGADDLGLGGEGVDRAARVRAGVAQRKRLHRAEDSADPIGETERAIRMRLARADWRSLPSEAGARWERAGLGTAGSLNLSAGGAAGADGEGEALTPTRPVREPLDG